jgi:hypothetical protein
MKANVETNGLRGAAANRSGGAEQRGENLIKWGEVHGFFYFPIIGSGPENVKGGNEQFDT